MGLCWPVPAQQIPIKSSMLLVTLAGFAAFSSKTDISDVDVTNSRCRRRRRRRRRRYVTTRT